VIDTDAVRAWAKQQLAAYKVPRRIHVVEELPKSMIGKVLRRKVRDELIASGAEKPAAGEGTTQKGST
jgi:long-chain acyl-CoA synthetase